MLKGYDEMTPMIPSSPLGRATLFKKGHAMDQRSTNFLILSRRLN